MPAVHTTRRLAAILSADVVGYSRMMGQDETGTLDALRRHRESVFDPAVSSNSGRVVKLIGDGTLAEFGSVVDAVKCALAVQKACLADASSPKITLRIGINLGDVIIEGDDIYGDGVNVAARLEPLAEPGGVCVSAIVNESVGTRVEAHFEDGGEVHVKNIERPIRIWKWHPRMQPGTAAAPAQTPSQPEKKPAPAIAVLPFNNMSGDPEQEYFSDGISEDIITDLSKVGGLTVIARNSSFAYKGKSPDIRQVGRELGVSVVLEGSVRRAGNRVRVNAQLIDAQNGAHIWADRFDRDLDDIFAVQDEVTQRIVAALKVTLTPSEVALITDLPTSSGEAHDLFLKGRGIILAANLNRECYEAAQTHFRRAIELDPSYGAPHAGMATTYSFDFHNRWTEEAGEALVHGYAAARKAVELDPNDPFGYVELAITAMLSQKFDEVLPAIDQCLKLNPNFAQGLNARGAYLIYVGEPEKGIPDLERAMRLDPGFSQQYLHFLGLAYMLLGKYETAAMMFRERIILVPETDFTRSVLVVALGHLGETAEAARVWAELKRINPKYDFEAHLSRLPFRRPQDIECMRTGFAKAGVTG